MPLNRLLQKPHSDVLVVVAVTGAAGIEGRDQRQGPERD